MFNIKPFQRLVRSNVASSNKFKYYRNFFNGPLEPAEEICCMLMGKVGVGKSSLFNCIIGRHDVKFTGLRDGTEVNNPQLFKVNGVTIGLIDTVGFQGIKKKDVQHFHKILNDSKRKKAVVTKTFVCMTSNRLSDADRSILEMIRTQTTKEFQDTITVIVTHTPPHRVEEVLNDEKLFEALKFLAPDKHTLRNRVIFSDLMEQKRFTGAAGDQIAEEWNAMQRTLLNEVVNSNKSVTIEDITNLHKPKIVQLMNFIYENRPALVTTVGFTVWALDRILSMKSFGALF